MIFDIIFIREFLRRRAIISSARDIDHLLQSFIERGLPGCGLQVERRGETIYEGYYGYADRENGVLVGDRSLFRQASMSKLPLYITMMVLFEKGKFLFTDPISNYFSEWKASKKVIHNEDGSIELVPTNRPLQIKDIMSMNCGLPYCHYYSGTDEPTMHAMEEGMKPLWEKGYYSIREQVRAVAEAPLAFEPGEGWMYGFSSELAAGIIEEICQKPIDDVFAEYLYEPLLMEDTRAHHFGDTEQRMVTLYKKEDTGILTPLQSPMDQKHYKGEKNQCGWPRIFSTVNDYTKLMQMLANGGTYNGHHILGRKTIDLMRTNLLTPQQLSHFWDTEEGYGYGFGVRTLINPQKGRHNGSVGSFGWTGGFGTWCEVDPTEGLSIVYMHNMMPNEEGFYHPRIRNIAYGLLD